MCKFRVGSFNYPMSKIEFRNAVVLKAVDHTQWSLMCRYLRGSHHHRPKRGTEEAERAMRAAANVDFDWNVDDDLNVDDDSARLHGFDCSEASQNWRVRRGQHIGSSARIRAG